MVNELGMNLHIRLEHGDEPHHIAEAIFKGFARAMDLATMIEPRLKGGSIYKKVLFQNKYYYAHCKLNALALLTIVQVI